MGKRMLRKGLAVAVILLFFSVSVIPSTGNRVSFDDITPPVTTCTLNPPEPNGENGWYVSDVEVTLNATDDISGVNVTEYRINGGIIKTYTEPFNVSQDGEHTVEYRSVDYAGNIEDWKSVDLRIDQTKPKILYLTYGLEDLDIVITAACEDAASGMDRVEFYFDDILQETVTGPGQNYSWVATHPDIWLTMAVAYDKAGNNDFDHISTSTPKYTKVMGIFRNLGFSDTCVRFDSILIFKKTYLGPNFPNFIPYLFGNRCIGEEHIFLLNLESGFIGDSFIRATFRFG